MALALPPASGETGEKPYAMVGAHAPADPADVRAPRTYFTAVAASEKEMLGFRRELIQRGARNVNFFPPDVIVCELPSGLDLAALPNRPSVDRVEESMVKASLVSGTGGRREWVRMCYQRMEDIQVLQKSPGTALTGGDFRDVVVTTPQEKCDEVQMNLVARGALAEDERSIKQNAEFLAGDVLVQLIFPESNGQFETKTEAWTDRQLADALSGAIAGMMSIQGQFPSLPLHYIFRDFKSVPTGYEPIQHNMDDNYVWIEDTLVRLDPTLVGEDDLELAHEFNNKARKQYRTDWVYTAFIANSENAPGHVFKDAWYTAYAKLGGPYMVQPFPSGGDPNGIGDWLVFSQIFEHESGHIFWALDEYLSSTSLCIAFAGYLRYQNLNKLSDAMGTIRNCAPEGILDCLMQNAARESIGRPWCRYTQGQMGLIDDDGNSVPDIYQSKPIVEFEGAPAETVTTDGITVKFKGISTAVPNQNPMQPGDGKRSYAAPLKEGRFNIDNTGIQMFDPLDGKWDSLEEEAAIRISTLPTGLSRINVRVKNAVGYWSDFFQKKVYRIGINYSQCNITARPEEIMLEWNVVGESFGARFDIYRLGAGEPPPGRVIATDVEPAGNPTDGYVYYRYVDKDVTPGESYQYYVEGRFTLTINGEEQDFNPKSDVFRQTAMFTIAAGNIVSTAAPNPFNEETKVSVEVPKTYESVTVDGGSGVPVNYQKRKATDVKVAVYDVLGRKIKTLTSGKEYVDVLTLTWDGTNTYNRPVPSGIYFIRAQAGDQSGVQKILLLR